MKLLFMLFIYPLEILMKIILEGLLSISGSSILSLIGLSLSVTIISFPLSHLAEKWQTRERNIQNKLKPKIDEFKQVFKGGVFNTYLTTLYRQNQYHPIFAVRSSFGLLIQIPFFFAAYHFISNYQAFMGVNELFFENLGEPDGLLKLGNFSINILPFLMTAANMISALFYGKKLSFRENIQLHGISVLFLVVLYNAPAALLIYWTFNNVFSLIKNIVFKRLYDKEVPLKASVISGKQTFLIFVFSALSLGILVLIAGPFTLLASGSASDIDGVFSQFFYFQLMLFTVYLTLSLLLYSYAPQRSKHILAAVFSIFLLIALINAFIFHGDYGDISNFHFENGITVSSLTIVANVLSLLIAIAFTSFLFYFKKTKYLLHFFIVIFMSLILLSYNEVSDFYGKVKDETPDLTTELNKKFIFSTKKNVLIIMIDRFIGGYIPKITELFPDVINTMDGFIWYSNSLSSGSDTLSTEPSIMGGWDYHADHVNKTREDIPLLEKMDESLRVLPYNFSKAGFDSSLYARLSSWINFSNKTHLENTPVENLTGKYSKLWLNEKNEEMDKNDSIEKLAMFGLFRVSSPFLRKYIYDDGKWLLYPNQKKKQKVRKNKFYVSFMETNKTLRRRYFKNRSTLDYLRKISETSEKVKPQFFYFASKLTHEPWLTKNDLSTSFDGKIKYPITVYKDFKKSLNSLKHLYTDAAALKIFGDWFKWMKENGVYDNTRIIIVSDHGRRVHNPYFKKKIIPGSKKKNTPAFWHNVLLVKDFNSHGKLRTDSKFMTSCDIPYMALKDIINGENPYTGNPIVEKKEKIPFTISRTKFRMKEQKKYKFNITESFEIIDSDIFNLSNWKRVEK